MSTHDRFKDYKGNKCWQAHVADVNRERDLMMANLTETGAARLRIDDFEFEYVSKDDKELCKEVKEFIERHEWLAKLPNRPTHRFTARLKKNGTLAGTIIMATPNAFSNLLGKENTNKEKLISRGACISWGPKNLGSWLITQSIKWMVKNTDFRYFTAYSDPEAKELGTIYQACNFMYLGQTSGTDKQYFDPKNAKKGWFSGREFRKKSNYYKYAEKIGINKDQWKSWMKKYSPDWEVIPPDVKIAVKRQEEIYRQSCKSRKVPPKHKYVYILGRSKKETKELKELFARNSPKKVGLRYPTIRGK